MERWEGCWNIREPGDGKALIRYRSGKVTRQKGLFEGSKDQ